MDIANAGAYLEFQIDAVVGDLVADQVEDQRLGRTLANQGDLNVGAFRPLEHVGDVFGAEAVGSLAIDCGDDVAGANTGPIRRSSFKREDHDDLLRSPDP